jgi:ribonuclease HI
MSGYNSLIGSVLQYASCVWQIGNDRHISPLGLMCLQGKEIVDKMKRIQKNGIEIKINWTPGHANVNGNEIAKD